MAAAGPVRGTKVLVLGRGRPIDCGSMLLADLGADVVMVEDPERDLSLDEVAPAIDGLGYQRMAFCRNKRSVALRATVPAQLAVIHRLLDWADVVLYDSANPVGRELAGTVRDLATRRPDLIACDGSTWGSFGERAGSAGNDLVLQASAGCMDLTGEADDPPTRAGTAIFDFVSGTYIAIAVLAALYGRQRSGDGRRIEVAGYDAAVTLLSNMASAYFATGEHRSRLGTGHISIFPYNAFKTSDGEIVIAIFTQAFWSKFCVGIGRPDLLENPRYKSIPDRMKAKDELSAILDALFLERTTDEWSAILQEADVPYGPVLPVGRALALDQTIERGMTPTVAGLSRPVRTVGSPLRFLLSDGSTYRPDVRRAPRMGEHDPATILATGAETSNEASVQASSR